MESLHIIKGLWNLSNIGAENSDTRIRLERDSLGRAVKEWQDAHWDGLLSNSERETQGNDVAENGK